MKTFKKNNNNIYINEIDRGIIGEVIGESLVVKLKNNQISTNLKISNSNEDIFIIRYSWVKYLKNLLDNEVDYLFEKEMFLQSLLSSNISEHIQNDLKRYLDEITEYSERGRIRRVKKHIERILEYKKEIEELSPKIILSNINNKILCNYKDNLNAEEFYEFLDNLTDNNIELLEIKTSKIPKDYSISFGKNIDNGEVYDSLNNLFLTKNNIDNSINTPKINVDKSQIQEEKISLKNDIYFSSFKETIKLYNAINLSDNIILNKYFIFLKNYLSKDDENLYTEDWSIISKNLRDEKEWTCSQCKYQAKNEFDKQNIHVHHKDRNPQNNSDENLIVLCANCHSQQKGSGHNLIIWKYE